jgi:hypothetical protein
MLASLPKPRRDTKATNRLNLRPESWRIDQICTISSCTRISAERPPMISPVSRHEALGFSAS